MFTLSEGGSKFLIRNGQTALVTKREDLYLSASSLWQPHSSWSNLANHKTLLGPKVFQLSKL
jgi:hypothetical protein